MAPVGDFQGENHHRPKRTKARFTFEPLCMRFESCYIWRKTETALSDVCRII